MEKQFDQLKWDKLMESLKEKRVDWKDKRLVNELYIKQIAATKINEIPTYWLELCRE